MSSFLGLAAAPALAATPVTFLAGNGKAAVTAEQSKIAAAIASRFDVDSYRQVRVQPVSGKDGTLDHYLVHLHSRTFHRVDFASVRVDADANIVAVEREYALTTLDHAAQPQTRATTHCPDADVQFIAFAPNDDALEQEVTLDVAKAAIAKGLKTIQLLKSAATRQAYLNYMSCPKVIGNFYDGDANPTVITTVDGTLSHTEFQTTLLGKFGKKMTNIWLACEAFNDPMKSDVIDKAQSRKYAAGLNDLEVGPSDRAAACAMKDAIDGKPMTAAFKACYDQLDTPDDHWGFDGIGTDNFWD